MTSYLVTGGAGAFGQAFVRRVLGLDARRVVVFSRGEARQAEMRARLPDDRIRYLIGDVRDETRVMDACRGVDVVVHAAALKRIEVCEADPNEATATNVRGTQNVTRACIERGVQRAVFLSTDKAAGPCTVYGATKLAAERLWVASNVYAGGMSTRFSATRYGNVANSTGSVIPLWRQQAATGVVTVTHPGMTRFWMTMNDAVDLVLLALREMRGGEVFVPALRAASLRELASIVAPDASLREVGVRPGEKVHETLISEDEARSTYDAGAYYIIEPESRTWGILPPPPYPKVGDNFSLRSDTAMGFSADELRSIAA